MKNISSVILFTFIALNSCELEKELDFKGNVAFTPAIVIHGFISPNDGVRVAISKSAPINDINYDTSISDATVILIENGVYKFDLIETEPGFFISPEGFVPDENLGYQVKVSAQGLKDVTSSVQYLMEPVDVDSLFIIRDTATFRGNQLFFRFKDPGEVQNFYHFKQAVSDVPLYDYLYSEELSHIYGSIEDKDFNGLTAKYNMRADYDLSHPNDSILTLFLFNLSPDFNSFLQSMSEYDYTNRDPYFSVTTTIFSNIKGGYGFFASYTYTVKHLIIKPGSL